MCRSYLYKTSVKIICIKSPSVYNCKTSVDTSKEPNFYSTSGTSCSHIDSYTIPNIKNYNATANTTLLFQIGWIVKVPVACTLPGRSVAQFTVTTDCEILTFWQRLIFKFRSSGLWRCVVQTYLATDGRSVTARLVVEPLRNSWPEFGCGQDNCFFVVGRSPSRGHGSVM
jgi:CxxC motif-containing protein